jgi:hypothetical protein
MLDIRKPCYFKVTGYKPVYGMTTLYVIAGDLNEVNIHFNGLEPEDGGLMRWSVVEVEELPPEAMQACPKCDHRFEDPRHVISLEAEQAEQSSASNASN